MTAMMHKEHPDLILLDIGLPAGDGLVVLERMREVADLACVPVIVISARDPDQIKQKALEAGATAFFQKPVDNAELLTAIWQALDKTSAETGG